LFREEMARGEIAKSRSQMREARYKSGEQVWVGQSRGSMREGTVVGYLGKSSYSVFVAGHGVVSTDEGLLSLRQEDGSVEGQVVEELLTEAGRRTTDTEKRSLVEHRRIRWYNPKLENFEWREVPQSDEEALSLLEGSQHTPTCADTYRQWRDLGASIKVSILRAGDAARTKYERTEP
jgi:hypothetical protein